MRALGLAALALMTWAAFAAAQEVEARLDRRRIAVGETTTLRVVSRGGNAREPAFDLPAGLTRLSSGRQQSFSWVNGRASSETEFQFEIMGENVGRYSIGPIDVTVGSQTFRSGRLDLQVTEAIATGPAGGRPTGGDLAWLEVDLIPPEPWVGQETSLRVRLFQRVNFAEDPQYVPPTTTGFWSDRASQPESYYVERRGERVLVTETRTRLYPLSVGETTVGEAVAAVVPGADHPLGMPGMRRPIELRSRPLRVRVRPLPRGAPDGFSGAVGSFDVRWSADRSRTPRDVPAAVRLDVRGRGNLPLVRPPEFTSKEVEVFAGAAEDSLGLPGTVGRGRKRFQWTLLPRRDGSVTLRAPDFSWFDPEEGAYRSANLAPAILVVSPPLFAGGEREAGFPAELIERPADPGARPAQPWAFALAGCAIGLSVWTWRRASVRPAEAAAVTAETWRRRVGEARDESFWKAAEDAFRWLESEGKVVDEPQWRDARAQVAAARYGSGASDPDSVREVLLARLAAATPPKRGRPERGLAVLLALIGVGLAGAFAPWPGSDREARGAAAADQAARQGDHERARRAWQELWVAGGPDARLAARIAWAHAQTGAIGPAALWVMRGQLEDPREPALRWVGERVREAGGLVGASDPRLPVRRIEWAIAALALGVAAGLRARSRWGWALAALTVVCAAVFPVQGFVETRSGRAVILDRLHLEQTNVQMDPGQVVSVREQRGSRVRIAAGRVTEGWVPAAAVERVSRPEEGG